SQVLSDALNTPGGIPLTCTLRLPAMQLVTVACQSLNDAGRLETANRADLAFVPPGEGKPELVCDIVSRPTVAGMVASPRRVFVMRKTSALPDPELGPAVGQDCTFHTVYRRFVPLPPDYVDDPSAAANPKRP